MSLKPAILMITPHPNLLHDRILTADGYKVTTVTSYLAAMRVWQPKLFPLVLILADRDSKDALEFCEEVKTLDSEQKVVFLAPRFVPVDSTCPNEVIRLDQNPEHFLTDVSEAASS
jgi:DNA-binding response OmpR family regulator